MAAMATACDPEGRCPRCGYQNGPGAQRCLRCTAVLRLTPGCDGKCTQCLLKSVLGENKQPPQGGVTERAPAASK